MNHPSAVKMTCRLELFVDNLAASVDFYGRVLGFSTGVQQADGYTPQRSAISISACQPAVYPQNWLLQVGCGFALL